MLFRFKNVKISLKSNLLFFSGVRILSSIFTF